METSRLILNENTSIEVCHRGAHLLSWLCNGKEQLYLSPTLLEGKAIRGGVPLIFPQFEEFGDGPRHGFARIAEWQPIETEQSLSFQLIGKDESWPYKTQVIVSFTLAEKSLTINMAVKNNDDSTVKFTCAFHTYFRISDIEKTQLKGLQGHDYWINAEEFCIRKTETNEALGFNEKTDRIYFDTKESLQLTDTERSLQIESIGFEDTVVWNPWQDDAEKLTDMPTEDYRNMLCVEPARVNNPVQLAAGESWEGIKKITLRDD